MDAVSYINDMSSITSLKRKYKAISRALDERSRRLWAAAEAMDIGWGGVSKMSAVTGLTRNTIASGVKELEQRGPGRPSNSERTRVRREGGGRKSLVDKDKRLVEALEGLVEPSTRGDPMSPLRWTFKSTRKLAKELQDMGFEISDRSVAMLLKDLGYSLQANSKTKEGDAHPDRNAQFEYICGQSSHFQERGQPVISVDTKKKELIGDFKNAGQEWRPKGDPEKVQVHDFEYKDLGKAIPYGIYDVTANNGWVNIGTDHDTAEFAVESIRRWWKKMGSKAYPNAKDLLITADGGGSNSSRSKLWKMELQKFADESRLRITVAHLPPGTSKWNKIEHRMFSFITQNWSGRPLLSHQVIVNLIANTTTKSGLRLQAGLDIENYERGKKISKEELGSLNIELQPFHGDWNYLLSPRK